ncbi:unnamed protein product [Heterobilharzia americana]|nr:unnamed protein product [Heterobilharzia americana]
MSKRILAITDGSNSRSRRRSRSPEDSSDHAPRKRKSRWSAAETDRIFIPGMPTQLPPNLTPQQERVYIIQLQIEDISRRLKSGDLGIPKNPEDRSPSPEPIYSSDGKRLNTREYRTRKNWKMIVMHLFNSSLILIRIINLLRTTSLLKIE